MNAATLLALLLAFGLRVYRLDGQSLWSDEGASVVMAGRSVTEIIVQAAGDIHPPLYYVLLHWWSLLVGNSEFALRFLSVAGGLVLVALVAALGRRLLGEEVAVLAAILAAFSPFLVYYAQEMRMYTPMATFSALSVWLYVRVWLAPVLGAEQAARPSPVRGRNEEHGTWNKKRVRLASLFPVPSSLFLSWERVRARVPLGSPWLLALAYILATAAALYSQYFAFTIVIMENLALVALRPRFWRQAGLYLAWGAAQAAIALLYLPWFVRVADQLGRWPAVSEPFGLPTLLRRVLLVFSFGLSWDATATAKTELAVALLLLCGLVVGVAVLWQPFARPFLGEVLRAALAPSSRRRAEGVVVALLYLAVPVLIMYVLSRQRPMYNPKFLLLATPAFYLFWAQGLAALRRGAALAAAVLLRQSGVLHRGSFQAVSQVVGTLALALGLLGLAYADTRSLLAYYHVPKYGRDDYRGLVRYVEAAARAGDAVLLNAPGQIEIFDYYYHGDLPLYPLPRQRPLDEQATVLELEQIAARQTRLWVVRWAVQESDPRGFIDGWLNRRAFRAANNWYGSVQLVLYRLGEPAGGTVHPMAVAFGHDVTLQGYQLGEQAAAGEAAVAARPGEILPLTLFWQTAAPVGERFTVFTHLLDPKEHIWGQRDSEPGGGALPTTGWAVAAVITDHYGLPVDWGTPPGDYRVEVGLYRAADGQRLAARSTGGQDLGDRLLLGKVHVERAASSPPLASLEVQHPLAARFGPLRLLGYDFQRLGGQRDDLDLRQGGLAHLSLYWVAEERPGADYQVLVRLLDRQGRVALERETVPADGNYPSADWEQGELVRDQHRLALAIPPGEYRLLVGVQRGGQRIMAAGEKGPTADGLLELQRVEVK